MPDSAPSVGNWEELNEALGTIFSMLSELSRDADIETAVNAYIAESLGKSVSAHRRTQFRNFLSGRYRDGTAKPPNKQAHYSDRIQVLVDDLVDEFAPDDDTRAKAAKR